MAKASHGLTAEKYRTEVVTDKARFLELRAHWQELHSQAGGGIFSDFGWISAWAEVYWTGDIAAFVALVWHDERLIAALPMRIENAKISPRFPLRTKTYQMLFDDRVGAHDLLIASGHEKAGAAHLFEMCRTGPARYLDLTPMEPSNALTAFHAAAGPCWSKERSEIRKSLADISGGWDAYMAKRSANERKKARKLDKMAATLVTANTDNSEGRAVLEDVFRVSSRSWKARNGTDIGTQDSDRAFFQGLFKSLAPEGKMHLSVLWFEGKPAANSVFLRQGDTSYGLVCDYDQDFAKDGLGRNIILKEIKEACAQGATRVDFLRETPFTKPFSDSSSDLIRLRIAVRPGLARWVIEADFAARSLAEKLFGEKQRLTGRLKIIGD